MQNYVYKIPIIHIQIMIFQKSCAEKLRQSFCHIVTNQF